MTANLPILHQADLALARRVLAAEPAAFASLFERYADRVFAHALRRTPGHFEAERVTEAVLERILEELPLYTGELSLDQWTFTRVLEACAARAARLPGQRELFGPASA